MIDTRVDKMNYIGDVTYCSTKVVDKYTDEESGEYIVDRKMKGINQHDEQTASVECTVVLPSS